MKSPGYTVAPHEWGLTAQRITKFDLAVRSPAMKSPGYYAMAPHEWGLTAQRISKHALAWEITVTL